jgi:hypothetical protein
MSDPIIDAINQSVETSHPDLDTSELTADGDPTETPSEPVEATPDEPAATTEELDDIAKAMEAEGIKAPAKGERENRIPYSRVRKIIETQRKKWDEGKTTEVKTYTEKLTAAEKRLASYLEIDKIASSDAKAYLQLLAQHNPAYAEFLKPAQPAAPVEDKNDPRPAPDAKFPDGTIGYSPEGFDKLLGWERRQAVKDARTQVTQEFEKRFGPIEQQWRNEQETQQMISQKLPVVRNQIAQANKQWGEKLMKDHEADIEKALGDPQLAEMSFPEVVAHVLLPKLTTDRNKQREEILKELNTRPAAARHTDGVGGASEEKGAKTIEDIIKERVAAAGLRP